MDLKKVVYIIAIISLTLFVISSILILTNTLNMWLVGIVSLLITIICFVIMKCIKNKENK